MKKRLTREKGAIRYENISGSCTVLRSVYNYDLANRLTGLTHRNIPTSGGATVLADYSFQYDTMNRITSLTHTGPPGGVSDGTSTFSYDLTSQVTAADHTPARPDEAYQYDLNGNRTGGGYQTGVNNQTTSDGTYSYQYDKEGNRTRRTKLSDISYEEYTWDHRNRLTNVTQKSQSSTVVSTVNYSYDIFNRLIKRSYDSNGPEPFGVLDTFFTGYHGINPTLELSKADPGSGGVSAADLKHRYGDGTKPVGANTGGATRKWDHDQVCNTRRKENQIRYRTRYGCVVGWCKPKSSP